MQPSLVLVLRTTTEPLAEAASASASALAPKAAARLTALRMLAARRLTEAQLWTRLVRRGYADGEIGEAVASCRAAGFLDDALFAQLFVDGRTKAVGDSRLIADLVRRGISREAAQQTVAAASSAQNERLDRAIEKLLRTRPLLSYPSAARAPRTPRFSRAVDLPSLAPASGSRTAVR